MAGLIVGGALWAALVVVVISVVRIARAADRIAEAQQTQTTIERMKFGVATGLVNASDLVKVEVPDAPPEDL